MASTSVSSVQSNQATWTVSGLSSSFNTTNYMSVGIASAPFSDGASSVSSVSSVSAPSSGSGTSASSTVSGLVANTSYTWYGYARAANGLYYNAGSATFTTLPRLSTPSITVNSKTQTSVTYSVGSVTNANTYWVEIYRVSNGSNVAVQSFFSAPTNATFSGLTASTSYRIDCYVTSNSGYQQSPTGSTTFTTDSPPVLGTPSLTIGAVTSTSIGFTIGSVSNAQTYNVDLYNNSTGSFISFQSGPSAFSGTFTGLSTSTTYRLEAYVTAPGYTGSSHNTQTATTSAPSPLTTPTVAITSTKYKSVTVSASSTNADRYVVEVYTSGSVFVTSSTGSPPLTITGLSTNTSYYLRVKAQRIDGSYSDSSWSTNNYFTTLSSPSAPVFDTGSTTKSSGQVTLYWSSVLYADNYELDYRVQGSGTWSVWSSSIGATNATVAGLTNGQPYEFQVRAYVGDYGNWTSFSSTVVATPGLRPANFSWTGGPKVQNQPVSVTASDWTNLCTRINEFRVYKSLTNYTFTTVTANVTTITAAIVNQAITAISQMFPPTAPPTARTTSDVVTASFFNDLVSSLNSIL